MDDIPLEKVVSHASNTGVRTNAASVRDNASVKFAEEPEQEQKGIFRSRGPGRRRTNSDMTEEQEGGLKAMGKVYQKIKNFSVVTRYFLYVLPLGALLAIPIAIGATVARHAQIGGVRMMWLFVWIEVVWLSLWVSKIFAHFLPILFQFIVGVVSSGVRKYALVLRALSIPISLVGWALISLLTFPAVSLVKTRSLTPT
jgi:hypothetical protein